MKIRMFLIIAFGKDFLRECLHLVGKSSKRDGCRECNPYAIFQRRKKLTWHITDGMQDEITHAREVMDS